MTLGEVWRRLRFLVNRRRFSSDLEEEMQLHRELAAQAGRGPFGNKTSLQERSRDVWSIRWLEDSFKDAGFAIRQLKKAPGFTAVAVLSLALGIGANTAIFTLIESTLLRPIPVKDAEQLRLLTWRSVGHGWVPSAINSLSPTYGVYYEQSETPDGGLVHTAFSPLIYQEFLQENTVFDSLFAFKELGRATAVVDGNAESVNVFLVSGDFYRGMEVSPVIGRAIGPENDVRTQEGSVVTISYEYWTRRFARSPAAIGKTIRLNGAAATIIGVNPEYFTGIEPGANFEVWAPLKLSTAVYGYSLLDRVDVWSMPLMGRLKPGISAAQAESEFESIFQHRLLADSGNIEPANRPHLSIVSGARGMDYLTDQYERQLLALFSLGGLVLLIACANVANLLLAKSAARQREISVRLALGAGRGRIARQFLTEGLLLAAMAGVAGVILGYWARNSIPALLTARWKLNPFEAVFDPKVLLVALGTTFLTGILFSLPPVWQSRWAGVNEALKEGSRGTASLSKLRVGRLLVVLQVTLSLLLLVGAGLFVRTFTNLRAAPLGFHPENVLLFALDPPRQQYPADRAARLVTEMQQRLNAIPGVASATFSSRALLSQGQEPRTGIRLVGGQRGEVTDRSTSFVGFPPALRNDVGSRFFETIGIPILSGRAVDERDSPDAPLKVVVNREFARYFFHQDNPIGESFTDFYRVTYQIVGVCGDALYTRMRDPIKPTFYTYLLQAAHTGPVVFEVKVAGDEAGVLKQIRQAVRSLDSGLAITDVRTQVEQIEDTLSQERLLASLAASFGVLALVLACIGIYGVMAYSVARRTSEIGIRVALGAQPAGVAWSILRETLLLAGAGVAIGIPAAMVLSRFAVSLLYGLTPSDPLSVALAVVVLVLAGGLAGYFPARLASRVDPIAALRQD